MNGKTTGRSDVRVYELSPRRETGLSVLFHKNTILLAGFAAALGLAAGWHFLRQSSVKANDIAVTASGITATTASISWTTGQPLTSQVEYGLTPAYGLLSVFDAAPVTQHNVTLTGLAPGTTYHYAALSTNTRGEVSQSDRFTFATASTAGSPVITSVTAGDLTTNSATVTWSTSQPLSSQVEYGTTMGLGSLSAFQAAPVKAHTVKLTGLAAGTTYDFVALSTSATGQVSKSANFSFATVSVGGTPAITRVTGGDVTTTSATIAWTTDQPLTSQVEYGTTMTRGSLSAFLASPVTSHLVKLTGLAPGTTYNYAVLSTNAAGQVSKSDNFTITTSSVGGGPLIGIVNTTAITATGATIMWTTDQPLTSQVAYGANPAYGFLSAFSATPVTAHSVVLSGLTPGKTYDYEVLSANSGGQVGKSSNFTFTTTAAPPVIKELSASAVTSTSAHITWATDQPATSQVEYGWTSAYGSLSLRETTLVLSHLAKLSGLVPGKTYHYAAMSANSAGMQNSSHDLTFTTPVNESSASKGAGNRSATNK